MPVPTTAELQPSLRAPKDEIETPALLVDLDAMEANIRDYVALPRRTTSGSGRT